MAAIYSGADVDALGAAVLPPDNVMYCVFQCKAAFLNFTRLAWSSFFSIVSAAVAVRVLCDAKPAPLGALKL